MITIKLPTGTFQYNPSIPLGQRGGFGQVFLGVTLTGEEVAVKKLHISAGDAAHRELRIAEELKGRSFDHVIPFLDSGQDAETGNYFVVMPRAEKSLQRFVDDCGPLNAGDAASILLQISKGLIEVGELVHRDLKPDNILLHEGKWKVADLGIARFVQEATASNTLKDCLSEFYAAPEQWRFERATHATDVYALGCIGYCLITGNPPFMRNPSEEHQTAPVPSFECDIPQLTTLLNMMLRKPPPSRPCLTRVHEILGDILASPLKPTNAGALSELAIMAASTTALQSLRATPDFAQVDTQCM